MSSPSTTAKRRPTRAFNQFDEQRIRDAAVKRERRALRNERLQFRGATRLLTALIDMPDRPWLRLGESA